MPIIGDEVDFKSLISAIKAPLHLWVAVAIAGTIVLFGGAYIPKQLGIASLVDHYRPWIGGSTLLSWCVSAADIALRFVFPWVAKSKLEWQQKRSFRRLSPSERKVLLSFIKEGTISRPIWALSGIGPALVERNFLYRSTSIADQDGAYCYNLYPWVWDYLQQHPEMFNSDAMGGGVG